MKLRQIKTNFLIKLMTFLGFGTMSGYCLTGCDYSADKPVKADTTAHPISATAPETAVTAPEAAIPETKPDSAADAAVITEPAVESNAAVIPKPVVEPNAAVIPKPAVESNAAAVDAESNNKPMANPDRQNANPDPIKRPPTKYGGMRPRELDGVQLPTP